MKNSNKFAWAWHIKQEFLEEYVEMHLNTWPEVLEEHTRAGYKNYSIFQNGNQFFYCFECDDVQAAFDYVNASAVCQRWNAITSKMVEGSFDYGKPNPIVPLREIFYLP